MFWGSKTYEIDKIFGNMDKDKFSRLHAIYHTSAKVLLCQSHATDAIQYDHVCVGSLVEVVVALI